MTPWVILLLLANPVVVRDETLKPVQLGLILEAEDRLNPETRAWFRSETERILKPLPVSIGWRSLERYDRRESFDRIIVLRLKGDCVWPDSEFSPERPLGFTHVTSGAVLPYVELDCLSIQRTLLSKLEPSVVRRSRMLGIGLGRVTAHEIYHVLSGSTAHAASGVAKRAFSREDLFRSDVGLDASSIELIRKRISAERPLLLETTEP